MKIIERYTSPDQKLTLTIAIGRSGEVAVGFEGGDWHTHPDILATWLSVPLDQAVRRFVDMLQSDQLPILTSTDAGKTMNPWVSDNMEETVRMYGKENCIVRFWSERGKTSGSESIYE